MSRKLIDTGKLARLIQLLDNRMKSADNILQENIDNIIDKLTVEVVQIDIVDGKLSLTDDKYQKANIVDGTEILFPEVNEFTEIHLYFSAESDMNIIFPDCKWRVEPAIEAGSSYEIVAVYNTIEWLVNVVVYS